jgi:hypothetical protein
MRYRCIVSYRTSRSNTLSIWRTQAVGADVVSAAAAAVTKLRRRVRRPLTVVGIYLHVREGGGGV